jgi:hypothetical protein
MELAVKEPNAASDQLKLLTPGMVKTSGVVIARVAGSVTAVKLPVAVPVCRLAGDKSNDVVVLTSVVVVVFAVNANEPLLNGIAEAGTVPSATSTRANPTAVNKKHFLIPVPSFHF